jgi:hypothetical protein
MAWALLLAQVRDYTSELRASAKASLGVGRASSANNGARISSRAFPAIGGASYSASDVGPHHAGGLEAGSSGSDNLTSSFLVRMLCVSEEDGIRNTVVGIWHPL